MEKTKIDWCDSTWNPVTGCGHGCNYCYARRIATRFSGYDIASPHTIKDMKAGELTIHELYSATHRLEKNRGLLTKAVYPFAFEPTLHRYRLNELVRKERGKTIFVCSMADLFGEWVPTNWIRMVFDACEAGTQHRYCFLTKNPERYRTLEQAGILPKGDNFWYGSTVTGPNDTFFAAEGYNTFLSIEPLLQRFGEKVDSLSNSPGPSWFILGAMSGPGGKDHQPEKQWVDEIVGAARRAGAAVYMKSSLTRFMGEENMVREFPWEKKGE